MRSRFRYANVAATLALVFSMSTGAVAARHYLITSTKQIKPSVLEQLRGKTETAGLKGATGPQGAVGPEGKAGLAGKEGPEGKEGLPGKAGPEGVQGREGKEGKQGPPGPVNVSTLEVVRGPFNETETISLFHLAMSVAECPVGSHAISGGGLIVEGKQAWSETNQAVVEEGKLIGWEILAFYSELVGGVEAVAYCAKEGSAVQASRLSPAQKRSRNEALIKQAVERYSQHKH